MDLGTRLRELRRIAGLTQHGVERETGIDRSRLSLAECNYSALKPDEYAKVETFLLRTVRQKVRSVGLQEGVAV
jgi:transcriptional regulator with XRE-family HTH domain